ncbi:hypothetical protein KFL_000550065 [Klebsormidium nitens]|uniref:Uncharacterized protein n=1 Tax=Klebsormidium nitens TaxID=105231 RepID=A0A1Y1HPB5_KLENI|nr:hypothetical protein KFL_000550065 [Klebsormidium nitens]|eukprot:GAQ80475.1 hypothetical protein KFL_000550065 [Klebsormidium nitens]
MCKIAVHVKYPHFKPAVEQLVMHMNGGRADAKRASVSIYMGKSTWKTVVKKLADEASMGDLGGAIRVSESTLKKHRKRADRSIQPKIADPAGQVDLSSRKVAKVLLPTEDEQPNGYIMNKALKELEAWAVLNSYWVNTDNTDDKANLLLDLIYSKKTLLQLLYQQRPSAEFNLDAYDKQVKAHMHDPPTAAGYKLVLSSHLLLHLGTDAVTEAVPQGGPRPVLLWDVSGRKHTRDGLMVVYVKGMKLQRSTAYEHTRNMLHNLEASPELYQVPGTEKTKPILVNMVDGGGDENPRFYAKKMASAVLFMRGGYELLICATRAAGWSAYNPVERGQCYLTQALDGCIFESDFYGKDAKLEGRNFEYAVEKCRATLNRSAAFEREIKAVVPPPPQSSSPFVYIDHEAFESYRKSSGEGGCGCQTEDRCSSARCRKCWDQGLPCTKRCKCQGKCGNPHLMPLPEDLACYPVENRALVSLEEIVAQLTPRDVEFWALKHGRFRHYWFQYKLCDLAEAESCWYCSRFGERQIPTLSFFPIVSVPDGEGKYVDLKERAELVKKRDPSAEAFFADSALPSVILATAWQASPTLTDEALSKLVDATNLQRASIVNYFRKKNEAPRENNAADRDRIVEDGVE